MVTMPTAHEENRQKRTDRTPVSTSSLIVDIYLRI